MATVQCVLKKGLTVGDVTHVAAVIREAEGGDLIDATLEAERLVFTDNGPALVISPTLVGLHTLRRQIASIGDYHGPLSLAELRKLSATDLSLLQEKALELESAALKQVSDRGRD